jgi:hypothetical protein
MYFSLGIMGIFFSGSLVIYGNSILYRKYCIFCGKATPCIAGSYCNATRLEGKILRYFIKNVSR